jgi:hypothetical protein
VRRAQRRRIFLTYCSPDGDNFKTVTAVERFA